MSHHGASKVIESYGIVGPVKAALESALRYLAAELGPKGIRVHAMSPGPLSTRRLRYSQFRRANGADGRTCAGAASSDHRGGRCRLRFPGEHYAAAMTGDTIYIDGGYHILD